MTTSADFPDYLQTLDTLDQHFRAEFDSLSTAEMGDRFAHFVQRLLPQTDTGSSYFEPVLSEKKAADGGVDLRAESRTDAAMLYIQSRLHIDRAEAVDSILSKFQAYTLETNGTTSTGQGVLFDTAKQPPHFLIVTLSQLNGVIARYEKTAFASREFYDKLKADRRIHFIDGSQILQILRTTYSKISRLPTRIDLTLETPFIQLGDVYIGAISGDELRSLYKQFGDALFFENVRDFLGVPRAIEKSGRTTPNNEIVKTLTLNPERMLSRNNGIVFGAQTVQRGNSPNQLTLLDGSVVNGCQTTMCIVESEGRKCSVVVKVVQTSDAWDITKSANYQTSVPDIDLELARYLRPQLVKRAALNYGVKLQNTQRSAFQIIDEIYERKVAYDETRLLYVGLFSRSPNNIYASNYTELVADLIAGLYKDPSYEEEIFETLFMLQAESQKALREAKAVFSDPAYASMFTRLYREDSLVYRCFLAVLALCGAINVSIVERNSDINLEITRCKEFLARARDLLRTGPGKFDRFYLLAVKLWMQSMLDGEDEAEVRRDMFLRSKSLNFTMLFRKIRMEADLDSVRSAEN